MEIKEKVLEHINLMKSITDCSFAGMSRMDFSIMMGNVIQIRREMYKNLDASNITEDDKDCIIMDWNNFCIFTKKITLKRGWSRVDTAHLAESLITEYEYVKPYDDKGIAYNKTKQYILDIAKSSGKMGRGYQASIFMQIYRIYSDKFKDMDPQVQK